METTTQIKEAIKELPIHERAVAIALKHIFDKIKRLTEQQQQQIDANHLLFISKFKILEKKTSDIVQGKNVLKETDLDTSMEFFTADEQKQKEQLMNNPLKIQQYWFKAVSSQFGDQLSEQENSILKAVTDIQSNITTTQIELILTIQQNNYVEEGVFHRRLILDNGMPISFEGEQPKWKSSELKADGLFTSYLFVNTKKEEQLVTVLQVLSNLVNEVIPYSLEYYLGEVGVVQEEEEEDQQNQNEDQEEDQ